MAKGMMSAGTKRPATGQMKERRPRSGAGIVLLVACMMISIMSMAITAMADTVELPLGEDYSVIWNEGNMVYDGFWGQFTTSGKGYVNLSVDRPDPSLYGDKARFVVKLVNQKNYQIWEGVTEPFNDAGKDVYSFNVGLAKGTYDLKLDMQGFNSRSAALSLVTRLKVTFKSSKYYESETNNAKSYANTITLGKKYDGVFADEAVSFYPSPYSSRTDYYKVKLTKGKKYQLKITNYRKLFSKKANAQTAYLTVEAANGTRLVDLASASAVAKSTLVRNGSVTFTAKRSGWHYIKLFTDHLSTLPISYKISIAKK